MTEPSAASGPAAAHRLARAKYVSFTTFRRNGDAVSTPVWIAPAVPEDGTLVVVTVERTGKVKRLTNDPRVEMTPCDMRGRVAPGAETFPGTARLVRDPADVLAVKRAIGAKYGLGYRVLTAAEAALMRIRSRRNPRAGILITPGPSHRGMTQTSLPEG